MLLWLLFSEIIQIKIFESDHFFPIRLDGIIFRNFVISYLGSWFSCRWFINWFLNWFLIWWFIIWFILLPNWFIHWTIAIWITWPSGWPLLVLRLLWSLIVRIVWFLFNEFSYVTLKKSHMGHIIWAICPNQALFLMIF